MTVELLSAYFVNNTVPSENLSGLIQSTYSALAGIDAPSPVEPEAPTFTPAVSIRKSLASRDHIISMIDGKAYKTLKRHLKANGLSPADYRERYKLPANYPMVAPTFSEERRAVAAKHGLGGSKKRSRGNGPSDAETATLTKPAEDFAAEAPAVDAQPSVPEVVAPPAKSARKARASSAKSAPKVAAGKASKVAPKSDVDGSAEAGANADQDLAQNAPDQASATTDTPGKERRKLKIRAGTSDAPADVADETVKATSVGRPKKSGAATVNGKSASDEPKPAKRAYKKRASKTAQA
ncbi:MAG: MucR family transcriptional regulator [Sphingobium sp.]|uniref:MucR family transcriptional regulator n=1 Tax=Sphingobium sp. TaxID=1912891 RepID=UPI0029B3EB19|nr:MucR family transcriptional regulator [Sphingobium sp.]MDX3910456.1 MucR family transcriptional regulator [Sphingobium sp.]